MKLFFMLVTVLAVNIDTELYMRITLPEYYFSTISLVGNDFLYIQSPEFLSIKECYDLLKIEGKNYDNYQFLGYIRPFAIFNYTNNTHYISFKLTSNQG